MEAVYLDTHVVIWLVEGKSEIFTNEGIKLIENSDLLYSSIVDLELSYLHEKGKLLMSSAEILSCVEVMLGCIRRDDSLPELINEANKLVWTRDPFDRLITAQASLLNLPLITKDKLVRKHYEQAVW